MTTSTTSAVAGANAMRSGIEIGVAGIPSIAVVVAINRDEFVAAFATIDREYQKFDSSKTLTPSSLDACQMALSKIKECASAILSRGAEVDQEKIKKAEKKVQEMGEFEAALLAFLPKMEQMTEANSSLVSCSMKIIDDAYREFCQAQGAAPSTTTTAVQVFNPTAFDRCVSALGEIEASYRQAAQEGRPTKQLKSDFEQAQRQVQEMNMASGVLTRQDVRGIQSFTQPPIETYYIDRSGTKYIQPDHSQLLAFGGKFFLQGEYEGIGLTRQQIFGGKVCDILYLTKKPDQIEFEVRGTVRSHEEKSSSWWPSSWKSSSLLSFINFEPRSTLKQVFPQDAQIVQRQCTQINLLKTVKTELEAKVRQQWKYGSYEICVYEGLCDKGLSKEYARKSHAIAFYYKKVGEEQLRDV